MAKINSLQIQTMAYNFFMIMAIEPEGCVYSYCISRQGCGVEKSLVMVEKREGCGFSDIHFILSKGKDMAEQKTGRFQKKEMNG